MRAKKDANHNDVVGWYRELGCSVAETHRAGMGVPDLVIGCVGLAELVEVKTAEGKLLPSQENFIANWRGPKPRIVRERSEVIAHVLEMRRRARRAA